MTVTINSRQTTTTVIHAGIPESGSAERKICAANDELVRQRIEDAAQLGDEFITPGQVSVEPVGGCSKQKQDQRPFVATPLQGDEQQEGNEQPRGGDLIGNIPIANVRLAHAWGDSWGRWEDEPCLRSTIPWSTSTKPSFW